jgi:hypothetical protein
MSERGRRQPTQTSDLGDDDRRGSDVAFGRQFVEVTARVHPFVQHPDDLDHTFRGDAIVEKVNRSLDPCAFGRTAGMSDVEAADT